MTIDKLKNRIECMNANHAYINQVMPEIIAIVRAQGLPRKKDGRLLAKVKDALQAVLDAQKPPARMQCYISSCEYSVFVNFKSDYQVDECSVNYYEQSIYLENFVEGAKYPREWENLPSYDLDKIRKDLEKAREIVEQVKPMRDFVNRVESISGESLYWVK